MLITQITLENIKSYRHISVDFRRGTTAISGANGAGKTTLVEAIGFALFDYLPYSQNRFVREGEKYGRVIIHLIGSDDRPYVVERRCGTGSRWVVVDQEADLRLEQSKDVLDKLHELFGIDHGRPLDSLFRDALGVPQGTFTSIFLEPASKRKQTFDALLQIEDYKTAAENLLEAQKQYKEQMQEQRSIIDRLTYETQDLDTLRSQLKEAHLEDERQKQQNVDWTEQLAECEQRFEALTEQANQIKFLQQRFENSQSAYDNAQKLLQVHIQQFQDAQRAQQVIVASLNDYQRYLQASEILLQLRRDAKQRDALLQQKASIENNLTRVETSAKSWQGRLQEVAAARQKMKRLEPAVKKQEELELQHRIAVQHVHDYNSIVDQGKRLKQQLINNQKQQEVLQRKIDEIEPLVELAERLPELTERRTELSRQIGERSQKSRQLQEKRNELRQRQGEREQTAEKLRRAEQNVAIIEEHRTEAEEMPGLQEQFDRLEAQKQRLEGNIEGYAKSRAQSAGGQCPLLHESCLNIKQRGLVSLEFYFEGLMKDEKAQLAFIDQQQSSLTERIGQIKKYAEALSKLGLYTERRDNLAEQLQRVNLEITRFERDVNALTQEMEGLKQIEQEASEIEVAYNQSKNADARVRELSGLYKQLQQLQEQARQLESDLRERRLEVDKLKDSEAQLNQIDAALKQLNDPRSHYKSQQEIVSQEDSYQQQLLKEQNQIRVLQERLQKLMQQLASYEMLNQQIAEQEGIIDQSQRGYQSYLQHEKEALLLPEREQTHREQFQATQQAEQFLQQAEQDFVNARNAFNEEDLHRVENAITRLRSELAALAQRMQHHQETINQLFLQIERKDALLVELEAAQQEQKTLEDLDAMMKQFRELIKAAGPHVLKAMLSDISAEANRIFGEIMGDRSAQLAWENDPAYEISVRRQAVKRSFAQLSGGEQMSAALAVRLALLKKLSTLNIAFFDEPTQNMDELRRMNLAEQIRRVRGFEQLFVISHDDTFEQGLDSLVRLRKVNGETQLYSGDENEATNSVAELPYGSFA